ncbi:hypothetical protein Rhopal_004142-T1 [Rhodotorula paludigena]|uniref:Uncharacterized protein n=1 Tax=Rhodotorula paludigena TaxID=86838 RepID=A0AAV5GMG9_9BASI|nr:hypothetical protein Rhopal_004142-T1 [Rhodotorula paludigena]
MAGPPPLSGRRGLLTSLILSRRGIASLAALALISWLFLWRPADSPADTAPSDEHGWSAQKLRNAWSWGGGAAQDEERNAPASTRPDPAGHAIEAGPPAQHNKEQQHAAPAAGRPKQVLYPVDFHRGTDHDDDDEPLILPVDHSSSASRPNDDDEGDAAARLPAPPPGSDSADDEAGLPAARPGWVRKPFGQAREGLSAVRAGKAGTAASAAHREGLLTSEEMDEMDARAEERMRLNGNGRSAGRRPAGAAQKAEEDDDEAFDDYEKEWVPAPDGDEAQSGTRLSPLNDVDDDDEFALADAPAVAVAAQDAAARAPLAAVAHKGAAAPDSSGPTADDASGAHAAAPAAHAPVPPPPVAPADDEPADKAAEPAGPALPKIGTGGRLGGGGIAHEKPPQRVGAGAKAGEVVAKEAGRRVGTGARPGAKGMGISRKVRRR